MTNEISELVEACHRLLHLPDEDDILFAKAVMAKYEPMTKIGALKAAVIQQSKPLEVVSRGWLDADGNLRSL